MLELLNQGADSSLNEKKKKKNHKINKKSTTKWTV
jgi:hypothetical protein